MSKFGELIDGQIPVLLDFYTEGNVESSAMHPILRDVAAVLGDKVRVIKIDINKNMELTEALRVKNLPTLVIYKDGEMKWRHSGVQNANAIIDVIQEYI
ncbi:thioredoxin family protein [Winogradskyella undariae]|uniref:thioredoxin family protein n=1 Tax=Winogradskyella undariae TaxID=1285465 RepID=UPI00156B91C3|nr:thioredoxin family protein [Winogradskyella undariae]NRR90842.1 thioredoxin family protein [Winogradskyella undariae]